VGHLKLQDAHIPPERSPVPKRDQSSFADLLNSKKKKKKKKKKGKEKINWHGKNETPAQLRREVPTVSLLRQLSSG